jgi:hypothetical protein
VDEVASAGGGAQPGTWPGGGSTGTAEGGTDDLIGNAIDRDTAAGGTGLTGGTEATGPGSDAGVTDGSRATATGANLGETEATGVDTSGSTGR